MKGALREHGIKVIRLSTISSLTMVSITIGPGQAIPKDGYLVPNDAPGFGLEFPDSWFAPFFA